MAVSLPKSTRRMENERNLMNKNPHQIVRVTDGDLRSLENSYIGMNDIQFTCQLELDGCKVRE